MALPRSIAAGLRSLGGRRCALGSSSFAALVILLLVVGASHLTADEPSKTNRFSGLLGPLFWTNGPDKNPPVSDPPAGQVAQESTKDSSPAKPGTASQVEAAQPRQNQTAVRRAAASPTPLAPNKSPESAASGYSAIAWPTQQVAANSAPGPRLAAANTPVGQTTAAPAPATPSTSDTVAATSASGEDSRGLMGPFYWRNQPRRLPAVEDEPEPADPTNQYGQSVGLTGPLRWTTIQQAPVQVAQNTPTPAGPTLAPPAGSELQLTQAEELAAPPVPDSELVPVPTTDESADPVDGDDGDIKTLAGVEKLGEEPEEERLQFLRTDTVLLDPGEMQCDFGVVYQLFENDFTVVDTDTSELVEARVKQRQLIFPMEIRYGVTRRVQFFIGAPVGWANSEFFTQDFADDSNDGGIGDTVTGFSFLLCDGQGRCTDTVLTLAATIPTGDDSFTGAAVAQGAPTLGNGFWALSADVLWIDTYDPVAVFYGVGLRHQFESEFLGVDVRPGWEYRAQLGVGFALNRHVTLSSRFLASFVTRTQLNGISVPGSKLEPMSMRFAATISKCDRLVEPFVDIGTTDDAIATRFGVTWTY